VVSLKKQAVAELEPVQREKEGRKEEKGPTPPTVSTFFVALD
jgi:hypothetical protein